MRNYRFGDVVKYDNQVDCWVVMLVICRDPMGYRAITLASSHEDYWPIGSCDGFWVMYGEKMYELVDRDERGL